MYKKIAKKILMIIMCISLCNIGKVYANASESENKVVFKKEDVKSFLDSYFNKNRKKYDVPGVNVAIVKDNREFITASYGYKNIEKKEPLTIDTTFPACSVSKLFTATAIMQLWEQKKLDLNESIEKYLPNLKIKNSYSKKITCRQLLTHSSGLDEQSELGGSTLNKDKIKSQQSYFETHIPKVIHSPGTVSCYSNMGYNLLGYIIEKVSGETYEKYIKKNILDPLQMKDSSVRIENKNMASGYMGENNQYEKQNFAYQYASGSSGIIATVKDMENFMIMHLNHGKYENTSVLNETTQKIMQEKQFANNKVFAGMGYGWVRTNYGDISVIKHEGALPGYVTTMFLIPGENVGVYVATNSTTGICFDFEEAFMKHFYGKNALEGAISTTHFESNQSKNEDISKYVGIYRNYDGISKKNMMKLGILFDTTDMNVSQKDEKTLSVTYYNQKKEKVTTELKCCGDGLFMRKDGGGYITFSSDENDKKISYAFTQVSHCAYEKISFWESKNILFIGSLSFLLLFISAVVIFIKLIRRKYAIGIQKKVYKILCIGQLLMVTNVIVSIGITMGMISSYDYSLINVLKATLIMQVIGAVVMCFCSLYSIYKTIIMKTGKIILLKNCTLFLIQVISIAELCYFNLFGINLF